MTDAAAELRETLVAAARLASRVCRSAQSDLARGESVVKADASPVTVADLASQAIVSRFLGERLPGVPLAGEEDASTLDGDDRAPLRAAVLARLAGAWPGASVDDVRGALDRGRAAGGASGRFFALDPIDGTKGFLRGGQYAVALALIEDGRVVAGVLGCPNLAAPDGSRGVLVHAVRGAGTAATALGADGAPDPGAAGVPLRVSAVADPRRVRLCESVETAHSDHSRSGAVRARLGILADPVRMDSQAKYAVLAMGCAEVYLRTPTDEHRREWIWDHAAGAVVVEEAGGRVTDASGAPLDFGCGRRLERNRGILATNGLVHDAVLGAMR